jgi:phosphatidylglycerophosphate synthase
MVKPKSSVKKTHSKKEKKSINKKREEWAVKLVRIFGTPLAKAIALLPIKIHPNFITILSFPFAILAGFYFFNNQLIYGAIFFFISYILDTADGALARLTNTESRFGQRLDFYIDIMGNIFMYFGLWYSQFYLYGQWLIGGVIIAAHYFVMAFGYIFVKNRTYKTIFPNISSYYSAADEGILTFFFVPIFTIFNPNIFRFALPILVIIQFVSYLILSLKQKEKPDIINNIKKILKL